jgi:hypothetical protein
MHAYSPYLDHSFFFLRLERAPLVPFAHRRHRLFKSSESWRRHVRNVRAQRRRLNAMAAQSRRQQRRSARR